MGVTIRVGVWGKVLKVYGRFKGLRLWKFMDRYSDFRVGN